MSHYPPYSPESRKGDQQDLMGIFILASAIAKRHGNVSQMMLFGEIAGEGLAPPMEYSFNLPNPQAVAEIMHGNNQLGVARMARLSYITPRRLNETDAPHKTVSDVTLTLVTQLAEQISVVQDWTVETTASGPAESCYAIFSDGEEEIDDTTLSSSVRDAAMKVLPHHFDDEGNFKEITNSFGTNERRSFKDVIEALK